MNDKTYKACKNFLHRFRARVRPGERINVVPSYPSYNLTDYSDFNQSFKTECTDTVDINMPEKEFNTLLDLIDELEDPRLGWDEFQRMNKIFGHEWIYRFSQSEHQRQHEASIRKKNQALAHAWEQYQILLKLSGG